jgi:hypothetical protein
VARRQLSRADPAVGARAEDLGLVLREGDERELVAFRGPCRIDAGVERLRGTAVGADDLNDAAVGVGEGDPPPVSATGRRSRL